MGSLLLLLCLSATLSFTSGDKVIQAQVLFRHGARQQVFLNWNWRNYKKELGLLTDVGVRQTYILGLAMRERYLNDLELLPTMDEKYIMIRSTNVNRTQESAKSFVLGLFNLGTQQVLTNVTDQMLLPPFPNCDQLDFQIKEGKLWQRKIPLKVFVQKSQPDFELRSFSSSVCPLQKANVKKNLKSELYKKLDRNTSPLIKSIRSEINDTKYTKHLSFIKLYDFEDTLTAYLFKGVPLPISLQPKTWKKLNQLSTLAHSIKYYQSLKQVNTLSSAFFNNLLNNFDMILEQKTDVKLHLYSAHDSTLLLILQALGVSSTECLINQYLEKKPVDCQVLQFPPYASSMIFELVEDNNKNHYVQLLFNGVPLKICPKQQTRCSYQTFRQIYGNSNIDLNQYCGSKPPKKVRQPRVLNSVYQLVITNYMAISIIIICLVLLTSFAFFVRSKQQSRVFQKDVNKKPF